MEQKSIFNTRLIHLLKIILFIGVFILAFWLSSRSQEYPFVIELVARFNYLAVFIIAVISGLNLFVPIPAVAFLPLFFEAGLNFWLVILTLTAGMFLADSFAFLLGKTGRHIVKMEKLKNENKKLPYFFLFLFATFAPFPNEVLVIPMGLMGYKLKNMALPLAAGSFLFNFLYAYGVLNIFDIIIK